MMVYKIEMYAYLLNTYFFFQPELRSGPDPIFSLSWARSTGKKSNPHPWISNLPTCERSEVFEMILVQNLSEEILVIAIMIIALQH